MHNSLSDALTKEFGEPIYYRETLALPGFNILIWHDDYKLHPSWGIGSPPHCDHQYKLLNSEILKEVTLDKVTSFTLAITMANTNYGLDIWDLHAIEVADFPKPKLTSF